MSTIKQCVNQAQSELGIARSSTVIGTNDATAVQMAALVKRVATDAKEKKVWPQLVGVVSYSVFAEETTGDTTAGSAVISGIPSTANYSVGHVVTGDGFPLSHRATPVRVVSIDSATQITVSAAATVTATGGVVTVAQDRYALPDNFDRSLFDTFWEQSKSWRMIGPMTASEWELRRNGIVTSFPTRGFRVFGAQDAQLQLDVAPSVSDNGSVFAFEYATSNVFRPVRWSASRGFSAGEYCSYDGKIYSTTSGGTTGTVPPTHTAGSQSDGGVTWAAYLQPYDAPLKDTDTCVFDDAIIEVGLKFYYCKAQRLKYDDYEVDYLKALDSCANKVGGASSFNMAGGSSGRFIGLGSLPETGYGL